MSGVEDLFRDTFICVHTGGPAASMRPRREVGLPRRRGPSRELVCLLVTSDQTLTP